MLEELIYTFLLSLSPFGEARAGIPYAVINDVNVIWAFAIGFASNLLIFPILVWLIDKFDLKLWKYRLYRKAAIKLIRRAKKAVGAANKKYGFWALMLFVMVPLPGTGAYIGTIAAYVLKMDRRKAFMAITIGVFISCTFMAAGTYFGSIGFGELAARK